ncbi:unnamed protein product [Mytilus coruscus]|uniref:Uncharacterized protein n=1 Tax=Mytilus coruscus TaxID=42192 RepID=A0A6J8AA70_MYTCO|nr:unnamed protein product [Mytilus coruscus]
MVFCSRAIPSSRAFTRRFYDVISNLKHGKSFYCVKINQELRADALVWLEFLENFNGKCYLPESLWLSSDTLELFTGDPFPYIGPGSRSNSIRHSCGVSYGHFESEVDFLMNNSVVPSTAKLYTRALNLFNSFRKDIGLAKVWPAPLHDIIAFMK